MCLISVLLVHINLLKYMVFYKDKTFNMRYYWFPDVKPGCFPLKENTELTIFPM